jgi:hypothetical protein
MANNYRTVPHNSFLSFFLSGRKVKGRGATDMDLEAADRYEGKAGEFEELKGQEGPSGPQRCMCCAQAVLSIAGSTNLFCFFYLRSYRGMDCFCYWCARGGSGRRLA